MTNAPTIKLSQGKRIRYAREAAGLTQQELADRIRVSRSTLSAWEDDKNKRGVSFNDLTAVARETGFDVEFFEPKEVSYIASVTLGNPSRQRLSDLLGGAFGHPSKFIHAAA